MTFSLKQTMAAGAAIVALATATIAPFEGLRLRAYKDVVGVPTVCYGETFNVRMGDAYTAAECKTMLEKRVAQFYTMVKPCIPADLPVASAAQFVSLSYNIGVNGLCKSNTIQTAFKRHDYVGACNAILIFNKAGGKVIPGLVNRRVLERNACLAGLSEGAK